MPKERQADEKARAPAVAARRKIHPEEMDALLREMHHCVRNNFQIIASLINLQKRTLPSARRSEVRFVEEHVQAMAVVYRIADLRANMRVAVSRLVGEVVDSLRDIAGLSREAMEVRLPDGEDTLEQRRAVALALLLAIVLPPFLGSATAGDMPLSVVLTADAQAGFALSIAVAWDRVTQDPLRKRLATAYLRQLVATAEAAERRVLVRFPFDR